MSSGLGGGLKLIKFGTLEQIENKDLFYSFSEFMSALHFIFKMLMKGSDYLIKFIFS
jgi:hypothetical protein